MKKRWIGTAVIWTICIVVFAGLMLNFVQVDLTGIIAQLGSKYQEGIMNASKSLGYPTGVIGIKGIELISMLFNGTLKPFGDSEITKVLVTMIRLVALAPYICVLLIAVIAAFRKLWGYAVCAVIAAAGLLFSICAVYFIIPDTLYKQIPQEALEISGKIEQGAKNLEIVSGGLDNDVISDVADVIAEGAGKLHQAVDQISPALFRQFTLDGLGAGWKLVVIGLGLLMISSIAGMFICMRTRPLYTSVVYDTSAHADPDEVYSADSFPSFPEGPGLQILFGENNGATISLVDDETIVVGSDPEKCTLVLREKGIEPVHCQIKYDFIRDVYLVSDTSKQGTWCENIKMDPGRVNTTPGNVKLYLGDPENLIRLR